MAGVPDAAPQLRRALGKWDLTAIGVNQVIGSAIFLLPADVARQVGAWGPLAFMAIGLLSLSIALARLPKDVAIGTDVQVEIRDRKLTATVVKLPFVRNGKALVN